MTCEKIGPVEIIMGERESRNPFSTSLLIRGKEDCTLIDYGGGPSVYEFLLQQNIRQIFLTHYHPDHTSGTHLFSHAQIITNPYDYWRLTHPSEMAKKGPFADLEYQQSKSKPIGKPQLIYPYDQVLNMSGTNVIMLHAPGHSEGFCCPYFPDHGILHIGDIDLTSFGPWYFSPDSHIDQFIQSAKKMLEVDARYYTTSHKKGTVGRAEFREKLQPYLDKIEFREERIIHAVRSGCSPEELVWQDIFFYTIRIYKF